MYSASLVTVTVPAIMVCPAIKFTSVGKQLSTLRIPRPPLSEFMIWTYSVRLLPELAFCTGVTSAFLQEKKTKGAVNSAIESNFFFIGVFFSYKS
jgi:hypothetical protein